MEGRYDSCNYKARREFLGLEFEVRLFDVDAAGVAVIAFQNATENGEAPLKFSRVFSRTEMRSAGVLKTLEGFVALVDSLELVEDAYFTGQDAINGGISEFAAFQLSSSLPGIHFPPPIVSQQAAMAYFTRAPVGLTAWNPRGGGGAEDKMLLDVVAKGLTELCRTKPAGLDAVRWLGNWFLANNPTQPNVEV